MVRSPLIFSISRALFILVIIIYSFSFLFLQNLTLKQNAFLVGPPLLFLFAIIIFKKLLSGFKLYQFLNPAYFYLLFLPIPLIAGLFNRNDLNFLIGDFWQVFFIFLVLFIVVELVKDKRDIQRLFKFIIIFCLLDIFFYFIKMGIRGYSHTGSLSSIILAVISFYSLVYSKRRNTKWLYVFLFLFSLAHLILTQTRTYWIGALLGLLVILFIYLRRLLRPRVICSFVLILLLLTSYMFIISKTHLAHSEFDFPYIISYRISLLKMERFQEGGSFKGRIIEAKEIISEYKDFSILNKLAGTGFGAIYDSPRREYKPTASIHHIHLTYLDILFYQGIIGLILFFWFIVCTISTGWKNKKMRDENVDTNINSLCIILILVFLFISLGANYIWANMIFSILVGIIYAYRKLTINQKSYANRY